MKIFRKIINRFIDAVMAVLCVFLGSAVVLYGVNAILRYGIKSSFNWIEEYTIYIIVLSVLLIQFRLEFKGESLSITVLSDKINRRKIPRRVLFVFQQIVTIAVFVLLFRQGLEVIAQNMQYGVRSPIIQFPMYLYFIMVNIAFVMVIIFCALNLFLKKWDEGAKGSEEDDKEKEALEWT